MSSFLKPVWGMSLNDLQAALEAAQAAMPDGYTPRWDSRRPGYGYFWSTDESSGGSGGSLAATIRSAWEHMLTGQVQAAMASFDLQKKLAGGGSADLVVAAALGGEAGKMNKDATTTCPGCRAALNVVVVLAEQADMGGQGGQG